MTIITAQRQARTLHAYLKRNGFGSRLVLAHLDGQLWWSDAYLMLPVDVGVVALLDDYNLKAEPMVCEVGRTIKKVGSDPADFQRLVATSTVALKNMVEITPVMLGGHTLLVDNGQLVSELWSADGGRTVTHRFVRSKLDVVGRDGDWRCVPDELGQRPAVRYEEGKLTGLLMPLHGGLTADVVLPEAVAA